MGMLNKILRIFIKTILIIILIIMVIGFIIVPLALTWAIPSQGTKYLKHPVHIQSVRI